MTTRVAVVFLTLAGLVAALAVGSAWRDPAYAQTPTPRQIEQLAANGQLIALSSDASATHQQVVVIDPTTRVLSVYHVERASGEVSLKSVRNIHWDLQMEEFNGVSPSPREIRSLLKSR